MNRSTRNQTGIALGALFGLMHTLWITVVAAGFGDSIVNVLEAGHFLSSTYSTTAFDPVIALTGIIGAVTAGYVIGWLFVYIRDFTGRILNEQRR